jgi:hypothetical protein
MNQETNRAHEPLPDGAAAARREAASIPDDFDAAFEGIIDETERIDRAVESAVKDWETKENPALAAREAVDVSGLAEPLSEAEAIAADIAEEVAKLEQAAGGREALLNDLAAFNLRPDASPADILAARTMRDRESEARAEKEVAAAYADEEPFDPERAARAATEQNGFLMSMAQIGPTEYLFNVAQGGDLGQANRAHARELIGGSYKFKSAQEAYHRFDELVRAMAAADKLDDVKEEMSLIMGDREFPS